jgi:hypothetical protein
MSPSSKLELPVTFTWGRRERRKERRKKFDWGEKKCEICT